MNGGHSRGNPLPGRRSNPNRGFAGKDIQPFGFRIFTKEKKKRVREEKKRKVWTPSPRRDVYEEGPPKDPLDPTT